MASSSVTWGGLCLTCEPAAENGWSMNVYQRVFQTRPDLRVSVSLGVLCGSN